MIFYRTDKDFNVTPDGNFAVPCIIPEGEEEDNGKIHVEVSRGTYCNVPVKDLLDTCDLPYPTGEIPWE